jgi:hypothetical protein
MHVTERKCILQGKMSMYRILSGRLYEKKYLEDLGLDGMKILRRFLEKYGLWM